MPVFSKWAELPGELKLHILGFTFAYENPVDHTQFHAKILPFFLVNKEFIDLALEAFYTTNIISIKGLEEWRTAEGHHGKLPPPSTRQWIRRMEFAAYLPILPFSLNELQTTSDWNTLLAISQYQWMFTGLKDMRLEVQFSSWIQSKAGLEQFAQLLRSAGAHFEVARMDMVVRRRRGTWTSPINSQLTANYVEMILRREFGCRKI